MLERLGLIGIFVAAMLAFNVAEAQETFIDFASMNIYNFIWGEGPTGEGSINYGFEVFIMGTYTGETFEVEPEEISLMVTYDSSEIELVIGSVEVILWAPDDDLFIIMASGQFDGEPPLGEYEVSISGLDSGPTPGPICIIGTLEDIPHDAPDMLYPGNGEIITDTTPVFDWEDDFLSDYNGVGVPAWGSELGLLLPDGTHYEAYPIDHPQTSLDCFDSVWYPEPPGELPYGKHILTVHSNHSVTPGFGFEHHRTIEFWVGIEAEVDFMPKLINFKSSIKYFTCICYSNQTPANTYPGGEPIEVVMGAWLVLSDDSTTTWPLVSLSMVDPPMRIGNPNNGSLSLMMKFDALTAIEDMIASIISVGEIPEYFTINVQGTIIMEDGTEIPFVRLSPDDFDGDVDEGGVCDSILR